MLLQSKAFDPKTFLATVHPTATFKNLSDGHDRLEVALRQRSEALKVLVEEEFDRFASVKGATMAVFDDMKEGPLADGSDYGVKALKESLAISSARAEQVYNPILDARLKADRLRSTLGVFERNKFFFNLPGILLEAVEAGRYDNALSAYKKGRYVADYRAAQLLGRPATAAISPAQEEQARRIIDKVWNEVERIVGDLRATLNKRLRDPRLPLEDVERTVDILNQLNPTEDPIWVFFDTRHQYMRQALKSAAANASARFAGMASTGAELTSVAAMEKHGAALDEARQALALRPAVAALSMPDADAVLANAPGAAVWRVALEAVKAISDSIMASLPSFWRMCKAYADGKYQRGRAFANERTPQDCRTMTSELVQAFAVAISDFLSLNVQPPATEETDHLPLPPFAPPASHALTTAHYLLKLLVELTECANDLGGVGLLKQDVNTLKGLLAKARSRFVETLATTWVRGASRVERGGDYAQTPRCSIDSRAGSRTRRSPLRPSTSDKLPPSSARSLAAACDSRALQRTEPWRRSRSYSPAQPARRHEETMRPCLRRSLRAPKLPSSMLCMLSSTVSYTSHSHRAAQSTATARRTSRSAPSLLRAVVRSTSTMSYVRSFAASDVAGHSHPADSVEPRVAQVWSAGRDGSAIRKGVRGQHERRSSDVDGRRRTIGQDPVRRSDQAKIGAYRTRRPERHPRLGCRLGQCTKADGGQSVRVREPTRTRPRPCARQRRRSFARSSHTRITRRRTRQGSVGMLLADRSFRDGRYASSYARDRVLASDVDRPRLAAGRRDAAGHLQDDLTSVRCLSACSLDFRSYYRKPSSDGAAELQTELETLKRTLIASRKATTLDFLCFRAAKTTA